MLKRILSSKCKTTLIFGRFESLYYSRFRRSLNNFLNVANLIMELSFAIAGIANTIFSLANSQKTRQILGKRYQNPIRKFVNFRGPMPTSHR